MKMNITPQEKILIDQFRSVQPRIQMRIIRSIFSVCREEDDKDYFLVTSGGKYYKGYFNDIQWSLIDFWQDTWTQEEQQALAEFVEKAKKIELTRKEFFTLVYADDLTVNENTQILIRRLHNVRSN